MLLTSVVLQIFTYGSFVGSKCFELLVKSNLSTFSLLWLGLLVLYLKSICLVRGLERPCHSPLTALEVFCFTLISVWDILFYFGDRGLLSSPGWTWTPNSPVSASHTLGLQICAVPASTLFFGYNLRQHLRFVCFTCRLSAVPAHDRKSWPFFPELS